MNKMLPYLGWGMVVLVSLFAWYQYGSLQEVRHDLRLAELKYDRLLERRDQEADELTQTIAGLRAQLQDMQQSYALALNDLLELQSSGQDQAEATETVQPAEPEFGGRPIRRVANAALNSPRFREISARMMLNARYGGFISSLGLSPEERDQLNELMTDVLNQQNELRLRLASGEITQEEFAEGMRNLDMESALTGFLTPEELDNFYTWQEQQEDRNIQQAKNAMSMQIASQAPGLTETNRARLAEALTSAMRGVQSTASFGGGGFFVATARAGNGNQAAPPPPDQFFSAQEQAYDNVLQQLQGTMEDDQMAIVEGYLDQQRSQMEMMQEMLSVGGGQAAGVVITR